MKIVILSHIVILIHLASISATASDQISTSNRNIHDEIHSSRLENKLHLETPKENNDKGNKNNTTFPPDQSNGESFIFTSTDESHKREDFYITRMKSEHYRKYRNLNRDLYNSYIPLSQRMHKFKHSINPNSEDRQYYRYPYFPVFHPHSYHPDYLKRGLRPRLFSNYDNSNYEDSYLDETRFMNHINLNNKMSSPTRKFASPNMEYNVTSMYDGLPPFLLKPTDFRDLRQHFNETTRLKEHDIPLTTFKQTMPALLRISKDISESKKSTSNTILQNRKKMQDPTTLTFSLRNGSERNVNFQDSHRENQTSKAVFQNGFSKENKSHIYHLESLELLLAQRNSTTSDGYTVEDKEKRNLPQDDSIIENLKLIGNNRVYYEKAPPNLNLSWYVYVNCSRDRCLLTNSTNETELINEGWILHNCTSYGCVEMYPKTESMQKFIGLMLLVFSLCILKIIGFLLVFYYCRRIKLSKNGYEDDKSSSWNEEKYDIANKGEPHETDEDKQKIPSNPKIFKEDGDMMRDQLRQSGDKLSKSIPVKVDSVDNNSSKVWTPPVQKIVPCLLAPENSGSPFFPDRSFEKNNSWENSMKLKKKTRSNIPRLAKRSKIVTRNNVIKQSKKIENMILLKPLKQEEENDQKNDELLLMNWDDEILTNNQFSSTNIERTPDWGSLTENVAKSFIRLDLNKSETSET